MKTQGRYLEIEIRAPREKIWDALADINNYHRWNSVVPYGRGTLQVGNTLKVSIKMPKKDARLGQCKVNEVKPGHYFILSRKMGFKWALYMEHGFIIHPIDAEQNRFKFIQTLEGSGFLWFALAGFLSPVWARFRQMNLDLKSYVEKTRNHESSERLELNQIAP